MSISEGKPDKSNTLPNYAQPQIQFIHEPPKKKSLLEKIFGSKKNEKNKRRY